MLLILTSCASVEFELDNLNMGSFKGNGEKFPKPKGISIKVYKF